MCRMYSIYLARKQMLKLEQLKVLVVIIFYKKTVFVFFLFFLLYERNVPYIFSQEADI